MYYKLAIINLSYNNIISLMNKISKFYIIITPTLLLNQYIIYYILNKNSNLKKIYRLQSNIIYHSKYNNIIYKIFQLFLTYNNSKINNFIFIDFTFYNLQNIKAINHLQLSKYLNLLNINKKIINNLNKFFINNSNILVIYHLNNSYLLFIQNLLITYNYNIIVLNYSLINNLYNIIINKLKTNYNTPLYFLFNISQSRLITNILNTIQITIQKIQKEYNYSKLYYNILYLLNSENIEIFSNKVQYYSFSKLIY